MRIPTHVIGDIAVDLRETSEKITWSRNNSLRSEASELVEEAADLLEKAHKLILEDQDNEFNEESE